MGTHTDLFRRFLRVMAVRPWHLLVPVALAGLAAALDGVAMALLVPLARGIAGDGFATLWSLPVLRAVGPRFHEIPLVAASPNRAAFLLVVGLILTANLARIVVNYIGFVIVDYRQGVFAARAKTHTFARFLTFGKLYYDRHSQGKIARILGYSGTIPDLFGQFLKSVSTGLRLAAHIAVMLTISLPLTLLIAVVLPLIYVLVRGVVARIRSVAGDTTAQELELSRKVFNLFSSIPLVKAYSRESESVEHYDRILGRLRTLGVRHSVWARLIAPLQASVVLLALLGASVAAVLIAGTDDPVELSAFCAFLVIARQTLPMFGEFSDLRAQWARFGPRLDRLAEVFDARGKFSVPGGVRAFSGLRDAIEIRDLGFAYTDTPVLSDVSARIAAGRLTAIVGPTGCGKSTLVALLARFYECPPGTIYLDGVDVREFSLPTLLQRIAVVTQDTLLFNDTLRNNLIFGLDRSVTDAELREVCSRARLDDTLAGLDDGLETRIGDRGVRLSGGEKQRLAIARALLKDAEIVILDEATAALDSRTEVQLQRDIESVLAGKTVIAVAHRLSTVRNADLILVLEQGRLVEQGDWDTLIARRGTFSELARAQDAGSAVPPRQKRSLR